MKGKTVGLDAAGLLFECARRHTDEYVAKNYDPALRDFCINLYWLRYLFKSGLFVVFDGKDSEDKKYEHARREVQRKNSEKVQNSLRNDPFYIAKAKKICTAEFIPSIVAPFEADSQLICHPDTGKRPFVVITGDSDLLAYGHMRVIIMASYQFRKASRTTADAERKANVGQKRNLNVGAGTRYELQSTPKRQALMKDPARFAPERVERLHKELRRCKWNT